MRLPDAERLSQRQQPEHAATTVHAEPRLLQSQLLQRLALELAQFVVELIQLFVVELEWLPILRRHALVRLPAWGVLPGRQSFTRRQQQLAGVATVPVQRRHPVRATGQYPGRHGISQQHARRPRWYG